MVGLLGGGESIGRPVGDGTNLDAQGDAPTMG